jgi:ribosome-associated protein
MLHVTETPGHCRLGADRKLHALVRPRRAERQQGLDRRRTAVRGRALAASAAPVKARLKRLAGRKWTAEGAMVIQVEDTRSQARNREIARERLVEMIRAALVAPKRRIATKPTLGSQRRRLVAKSVRGEVKALRGKPGEEE